MYSSCLPYFCIINSEEDSPAVHPLKEDVYIPKMDEDIYPQLTKVSIKGTPQKNAHLKFSYSPLESLFPCLALLPRLIIFNLQ